MFTKGFLLYNLLILISLLVLLNVSFTLKTPLANLNTFNYLYHLKYYCREIPKSFWFCNVVI